MNNATCHTLFARLDHAIPHATTELQFNSSFELLIAVVLSAQATDKSVNQATASLFTVANTPQGMLDLGVDGLKSYIKRIGLYNSKASHIIALCERLLTTFDGEVPGTREQLQSLPGVGRKTANVILNTAFNQATIAVDTHIFRLANRIGLAPGKTVLQVELALEKVVPDCYKIKAHHLLILHGRYTCTARKPKCASCAIADLCEFDHKTV